MRIAILLTLLGWWCIGSPADAQSDRYSPPPTAREDTLPAARSLDNPQSNSRELSEGIRAQEPARPATAQPQRSNVQELPSTSRPAPTVDARYAEQLMRAMLTSKPGSQLNGEKISLADVVGSAGSRNEQSARINAYWDLCSSVADYYLSLHEQAELERLAARSPALTAPLRAAVAKLKTRRDTALTAARAGQHRLADMMGGRAGASLPLPGDMPLCGPYRTRFEETFPGGGPQEAAELDKLLPLRYAELLDAAAAVNQSEEWFVQVVRPAEDAAAASDVVFALELLALRRRAFVQIARDYNRRITRYTELARPGELRTARLVAMLIKTEDRTAARGEMIPPGRSSQTGPPETFRSDWESLPADVRPRLDDRDVLPAGSFNDADTAGNVSPGEASVLRRDAER